MGSKTRKAVRRLKPYGNKFDQLTQREAALGRRNPHEETDKVMQKLYMENRARCDHQAKVAMWTHPLFKGHMSFVGSFEVSKGRMLLIVK